MEIGSAKENASIFRRLQLPKINFFNLVWKTLKKRPSPKARQVYREASRLGDVGLIKKLSPLKWESQGPPLGLAPNTSIVIYAFLIISHFNFYTLPMHFLHRLFFCQKIIGFKADKRSESIVLHRYFLGHFKNCSRIPTNFSETLFIS